MTQQPGAFPAIDRRPITEQEAALLVVERDARIDVLHRALTELQAWNKQPILTGPVDPD